MSKLRIGENDLYTWCTNNGEYGAKMLEEWTGIDEFGKTHDIHETHRGTHIRMHWSCKICNCNDWIVSPKDRMSYFIELNLS